MNNLERKIEKDIEKEGVVVMVSLLVLLSVFTILVGYVVCLYLGLVH